MTEIRPFHMDIPQSALDDLHDRLVRTRFTDQLPPEPDPGDQLIPRPSGWGRGVPVEHVRRLVEHWRDGYDWRAWEERINAFPQFTTEIDGQRIHFLHIRSTDPDAVPLILTHSWPGTFVEYLDLIEPLTRTFHLVIPSIPGFGFSGTTTEAGWNRHRIAAAWVELMHRLGYRRYGAAGNDAGSLISPEVGRLDPECVIGVHVTQVFSFPSGDPAEFAGLSEEDHAGLAILNEFWERMGAFNQLHAQQPQTLAHALADSPAGLLGWHAQLFGTDVDDDFVLTNTSLHWLTNTAGSAIRLYYEDAQAEHPTEPTTVPLGVSMASGDFQSIRRFADRDHKNIVFWRGHERGGHYAAHLAPDQLAGDLREFFDQLP